MTKEELRRVLNSRWVFAIWLEALEPTRIVGHRADAQRCPFAAYLRDVLSDADADVRVTKEYVSVRGVKIRSPEWLFEFVTRVDTPADDAQVSAGEALDILYSIPSARRAGREDNHA